MLKKQDGDTAPAKKKKREKWIHFRHRVVRNIAYALIYPYSKIVFGMHIEKFREKKKRQYLIIMNHQTAFDQFFLGMAFRDPIYYIASEDLFSKGWTSKLIKYLVAPIPFQKSTSDFRAIRNCFKIVREGGNIAFFPEGNRTYGGRTGYIKPSVVTLAKGLKLPLVIMNITGGFASQPRWSDRIKRGNVRARVTRVLEYEDYKDMPDEEMFELIKNELYVDESKDLTPIKNKHGAEYVERAFYVCPFCGISHFESNGNVIRCQKCGRKIEYLPTRELRGEGFDFPFKSLADWYDYQNDYINGLDISNYTDTPVCSDTASFIEVIVYKTKIILSEKATVSAYNDRLTVEGGDFSITMPYSEIKSVSAVGRNKINIYFGDKLYQIKSAGKDKRLCSLKYMNLYFHAENIRKGADNDKFLGL